MPRVADAWSESVLRVPKLTSFCSSCCSRSSEIASISLTMRGSIDGAAGACAWIAARGTASIARVVKTSRRLAAFDMFEIVPGGDARRFPERRVVEIDPGAGASAVGQCHVGLLPPVEAAIGVVVAVALDLVERGQHDRRGGHLLDLAPDAAFAGRRDRRIESEVEQRALHRAAADVSQLVVDAGAAAAVESRHQRTVEENQLAHRG